LTYKTALSYASPHGEDIEAFLKREIAKPIIRWQDSPQLGYEILPNKYFYRHQPPPPAKELLAEFWRLEKEAENQAEEKLSQAVRELAAQSLPEGAKIETPADLLPHVRHYADRKQEYFLCATINGANEILNIRVVSIGLIDRTPVHPREVFADALSDRASAIIVAHNHPAGSLEPSASDAEATKQLKAAGIVMGITLLDHIIFNRSGYFSFLEAGRL
jgi:DNA repair protein RadC